MTTPQTRVTSARLSLMGLLKRFSAPAPPSFSDDSAERDAHRAKLEEDQQFIETEVRRLRDTLEVNSFSARFIAGLQLQLSEEKKA